MRAAWTISDTREVAETGADVTKEATERFERIETTIEKLAGVVNTLAASVVARDDQIEAHDRQIAALIELAAKHEKRLAEVTESIARTERQWQAYINTLPKQ
jgi:uncharacterized protein (DUF3084 family)